MQKCMLPNISSDTASELNVQPWYSLGLWQLINIFHMTVQPIF